MLIGEVQKKKRSTRLQAVAQREILKGEGGIVFTLFQGYFFRKNKFETVGETRKALGGSEAIVYSDGVQ